ncbi:hypothetical protein RND81_11G222600 [Saponaria officinalis]|uniref:Reverse transcriptase domain-containing protein n=1 Tax=Saponaria officinalis TaxID=3572 RepID=A0AAW1HQD2_SAPOF
MKLLSLNCRGLGNPDAVGGLRSLLRREAPAITFLCETKLSSCEFKKMRSSMSDYDSYEVDNVGRSGGLAMIWRKDIACQLRSASIHHIDFDVDMGGMKWRLTGVYGWPAVHDRHLTWQLLRDLAQESNDPWLCIGDFNEILYSNEMKGGTRAQWQMNKFQDAIDECGLRDMSYQGYMFTYDNGQEDAANRQSRLDRALATESWSSLYPFSKLVNLDCEWSDHAPVSVLLEKQDGARQNRASLFRFEQIWVGEEGCEDVIRSAWESGIDDVTKALSRCASELRAWNGNSIGKIMKGIHQRRRRLKFLNEGGRLAVHIQERRRILAEITQLTNQEEIFWRQRSRALWLKEGDKNTKFFHRKAGQRRKRNHISKLIDDARMVYEGDEQVNTAAVDYFKTLFTSSNPMGYEGLLEGMENRVTEEMNAGLREPYRKEEILEALNQIHPLKAPGPDVYKLVSKVLTNRLKRFLGNIVSENKSAFTPGRLITDNILVAFEMFHHMKNNRSRGGHMALKLDMSKAYDRVEWNFLEAVMHRMGLDTKWIDRVMTCVRTASYSVLEILKGYEEALGQMVNYDKTMVSFSKGTSVGRRNAVVATLEVRVVEDHDRYLGLPTVVGHSKTVVTNIVRDKLSKKLQG